MICSGCRFKNCSWRWWRWFDCGTQPLLHEHVILNNTKSLKDFREAFKVLLIIILVFMRSTRNFFSIVSCRLAC